MSPGEKSFVKPSVVDREAKRNATPRDSIRFFRCPRGVVEEDSHVGQKESRAELFL